VLAICPAPYLFYTSRAYLWFLFGKFAINPKQLLNFLLAPPPPQKWFKTVLLCKHCIQEPQV
jgi:hypothetical protein